MEISDELPTDPEEDVKTPSGNGLGCSNTPAKWKTTGFNFAPRRYSMA